MASSHAICSLSGTEPEGEPRHRGDANRLSDDETDDDPQGDARRRGGAQGVRLKAALRWQGAKSQMRNWH
jgi:hypothetical protein